MILDAVGQVLGEAVGILLSPLPIVAVILMLFTARSKANSLSFLSGVDRRALGARCHRPVRQQRRPT